MSSFIHQNYISSNGSAKRYGCNVDPQCKLIMLENPLVMLSFVLTVAIALSYISLINLI